MFPLLALSDVAFEQTRREATDIEAATERGQFLSTSQETHR